MFETWIDLVQTFQSELINFFAKNSTVFILEWKIRGFLRKSKLSKEKKQMALDSFIGGLETIINRLRYIKIED